MNRGLVWTQALLEVHEAARALTTITSPTEVHVKAVNAVTQAKQGSMHVLRQAIYQTKHLTTGSSCNSSDTRRWLSRQWPKEIEEEKGSVGSLISALFELPLWRKSLRAGSTKKLEAKIVLHAEHLARDANDVEGLEEVCTLLSTHLPTTLDIEELGLREGGRVAAVAHSDHGQGLVTCGRKTRSFAKRLVADCLVTLFLGQPCSVRNLKIGH